MAYLKDFIRLVLTIPACFFSVLLKSFGYWIVHVDSTRLGHFFCDLHLTTQRYSKRKLKFLVPLTSRSITTLNDVLPKNCVPIYSPGLKKFAGWFRHFPFIVFNATNSHTHINDQWLFRKIKLPNRYQQLIQNFDHKLLWQFEEFSDHGFDEKPYVAFHWRSGWDSDNEQAFRNTNPKVAYKLCETLICNGYSIVNLGTDVIDLHGVDNPRRSGTFTELDMLKTIRNAEAFVGDSSGPTMVALLFRMPVLIFDIFPPDIFPSNEKSLVHYSQVLPSSKDINQRDFVESYRTLTYGSELNKQKVRLEKLSEKDAITLVNEFLELQNSGPTEVQRNLQKHYSQTFGISGRIGYVSSTCKANHW